MNQWIPGHGEVIRISTSHLFQNEVELSAEPTTEINEGYTNNFGQVMADVVPPEGDIQNTTTKS